MPPSSMDRADFVTSLVLIALGLGALNESWRMPRLEQLAINPYTVPGIVPGLLSVIILVLGTVLLVRSLRRGGWRIDLGAGRHLFRDQTARRLGLGLVLTFGYAVGLVGRVPYWLATVLFVLFFITLFEWKGALVPAQRVKAVGIALVQALAVATVVSAVFQYVFLVRLP